MGFTIPDVGSFFGSLCYILPTYGYSIPNVNAPINLVKVRRIFNIKLIHNRLPIKWKTTQLNARQMALSFSVEKYLRAFIEILYT